MKAVLGGVAAVVLAGAVAVGLIAAVVFGPVTEADPVTIDAAPIACALPGDTTTADGLDADQAANVAAIIATARELGVPERGILVALVTAAQESMYRSGLTEEKSDRDSAGLFQQRPDWGSLADRLDPVKSTTLFFTSNRGHGLNGLLHIDGWEAMPLAQAAQTVQISAVPSAYAKWEPLAVELVGGVTCDAGGVGGPLAGNTLGEKAVNAAIRYLGTPYSWGGGNAQGPTTGICGPAGCQALTTVGFDCSGLTLYAWAQATGGKVALDHFTGSQWNATQRVPIADLQPGDLVFFGANGPTSHHMGLYVGGGQMIEAPRTGADVRYSSITRGDLLPYGGRVVVPGEKA